MVKAGNVLMYDNHSLGLSIEIRTVFPSIFYLYFCSTSSIYTFDIEYVNSTLVRQITCK